MAKTKEITCACGCGKKKKVRVADIKRGWGRYYSKSCKAVAQTRKLRCVTPNGRGSPFEEYINSIHPFSSEGLGQDGYG